MKMIGVLVAFAVTAALAIGGWDLGSTAGMTLALRVPALAYWPLSWAPGALGLVAGSAIATYLVAPVTVWLSFSMPSDIRHRSFDPDAHSLAPGAREYIAAGGAVLVDLGFERATHVAAAHGALVSHFVLFWNRQEAAVAQIVATNAMNAIVFRTRFESGNERVSHSAPSITTVGTAPWELVERFPDLDLLRLWAAHRALVASDEGSGECVARPDPSPVSDGLAYMHDYEQRHRAWREQIGQRWTDARGNIRLTLSSAFRTTWMQIPWHQKRLRAAARVRAEALLVQLRV